MFPKESPSNKPNLEKTRPETTRFLAFDFVHAVEFSRIGRTQPPPNGFNSGQLLYLTSPGSLVKSALSAPIQPGSAVHETNLDTPNKALINFSLITLRESGSDVALTERFRFSARQLV
jgi:hypothetical protein